jgi:hypothetical protein
MQASAFLKDERAGGQEALLGALHDLDILLERALQLAPYAYGWEQGATQFRGLYITKPDVERTLARETGAPPFGELGEEPFFAIGDVPALQVLAERHALSWFDCAVLLIAMAPEIDLRYERIYAYLQDDVSRRRPTVDLILNLLCPTVGAKLHRRSHFASDSVLVGERLIHLAQDNNQAGPPLLAHSVKLDEQVIRELLGSTEMDCRLGGLSERLTSEIDLASLPLEQETIEGLRRLALSSRAGANQLRLSLGGPAMPLKRRTAEAVANCMGRPLMTFDLGRAVALGSDVSVLLAVMVREAQLFNAVLFVAADGVDERTTRLLAESLEEPRTDAIVSMSAPAAVIDQLAMVSVEFVRPSFPTRREQWRRSLSATRIDLAESELDSLAGRFRLYPDQICAAVTSAHNRARWRGSKHATMTDLSAAARAQSGRQIGGMARKIEPVYSWNDIVLPPATVGQLRAICSRVVHQHRVLDEWGFDRKLSMGKGVTVLFAGPSGVGKTMAAEIIATELDIDLYKIDLAGVVSKYIGETEKNLDRIFAAAENANAILFFDEADALFGKRSEVKDSHDRYANIEISYLLQKMEMYDGIAILATNLRQNLDDAFLRRLAFTVHFPFPDEGDRRRIWTSIWPAAVPLDADIDFDFLAARFKLSGGNIKNVALAAAFLAAEEDRPVGMRHLVTAVEREYEKMGKPLGRAVFGQYGVEDMP